MFREACRNNRQAIYGVACASQLSPTTASASNGTAFMVAPGVLVTAAHMVHVNTDMSQPVHQLYFVIRAPDIGQPPEQATLIANDDSQDMALLRIANPRSASQISLSPSVVPVGSSCGSLGFPLSSVEFLAAGLQMNVHERFQGAHISAYQLIGLNSSQPTHMYETDRVMYGGSSGCPGFLVDGQVFGMMVSSLTDPTAAKAKPQGLNRKERRAQKAQHLPEPPAASQAQHASRLAISMWVPSMAIIEFARANGVEVA